MNVGENIRKYRKAAGLTRDDLAVLVHVEEKEVAYWERDLIVPDEALIYRIASALNVSPDKIDVKATGTGKFDEPQEIQSGGNTGDDEEREFSLKVVTPLEKMLKKGENFIWTGRPSIKNRDGLINSIQVVFGSLWIIVICFWIVKTIAAYPPLGFIGVPLIVVWILNTLKKVHRLKKQKESTYYAITNERIIIGCDYKKEIVKSIPLSDIRTIRLEEAGGGVGNIVFIDEDTPSGGNAPPQTSPFGGFRLKSDEVPLDGFYGIENIDKVCDVLRGILV